MINKILYMTLLASGIAFGVQAQKSDGSTRSLLNAEKEFADEVTKKGTKDAYLAFSASDALVFRPNPVNAKTFYHGAGDDSKGLTWAPAYARVSRSGDWGFTTGAFTEGADQLSYGQYLSIWKVVNGKWELALDLGVTHNKPLNKVETNFVEPKDYYKPKFATEKQMAAGTDIILTTEKTLNTTLKSYGAVAFAGFVNPDVRVLFPGYEPIIGKDKAVAFFNGMVKNINLKTTKAVKALGGDLAYTYGVATIDYKAELRESFNYVFIYERQPDHNWNLIAQVFAPAER